MTPGDDLGRFRYLELCNIHVVLAVGLELNFRKSPTPPLAELEKVMWKYCVGKGSECKTDLQCDGEKKCEYVPIGA